VYPSTAGENHIDLVTAIFLLNPIVSTCTHPTAAKNHVDHVAATSLVVTAFIVCMWSQPYVVGTHFNCVLLPLPSVHH
jgi:hypothetical protein